MEPKTWIKDRRMKKIQSMDQLADSSLIIDSQGEYLKLTAPIRRSTTTASSLKASKIGTDQGS